MSSKRSYAIIGTGALGGYYGGLLARAGFDVHFLLRSDFDHVQQHGLQIDSKNGNFHLPQVNAYRSAAEMPACDVTIVAIKTTANQQLAEILTATTREGGVVVVLQTGLHVEADSAAVVGPDRVLGGCCFLCSNKVGPGHIDHIDYGRIAFGEYRADGSVRPISERTREIEADLKLASIPAEAVDDLIKVRWQKLMWNIPFNGLSVVLDASTAEIMNHPASEALAEQIIRDVRAAAMQCGKSIDEAFIYKMMNDTRAMVPYDSSMRVDFKQGRPMEVEAIVGNPLRELQRHGGQSPRLEMLYQQLTFFDRRRTEEQTSRG
ncbi:putative 2-dehydropantoate 2-reductase [Rosistilla oblonga]|uniref:putative 2-dehydropantoate 2-reductase n=1 Tax=Rosistilla oblonga TaxID=2527990 RepID=UPI003A96FC37